jgi:uncharacterized protein (TIRG00374 family)
MTRGVEVAVEYLKRASRSVLVRLLVTVGLLTVIAFQVNWSAARERLTGGHWGWFGLAVGALVVSQLIGALRWHLLLQGAGLDPPRLHVLRAYVIGLFSNNFLPTSFGGDVARAWIIARSGPRLVRALTSVAVDRITAIWCLLAVSWIALAADHAAVPGSLVVSLLAVTLGGSAAMFVILLVALRGGQRLGPRLPERLLSWAREIRETLWLYVRQPRILGSASLLGLVFQALAVTVVWSVARAIDLHLAFSLAAVAAPLILVITLVPLSLAGFGIREGGTVLVLGAAGFSATDATLLSLIGVAALVIATLPGAVAMVLPAPTPSAVGNSISGTP